MSDEGRRHRSAIADIDPLDVDGVRTVAAGTLAWLIAFVALLPFYATLAEQDRVWWLWTCLAGFALGLVGVAYCRRRRSRLSNQSPRAEETSPLGPLG